jgi:hypothetical protein
MDNPNSLNKKLQKRITGRSNSELLSWLELAFAGCMRYAEEYGHYNDVDALGELNLHLGTVNAVVDELVLRQRVQDEEDLSR